MQATHSHHHDPDHAKHDLHNHTRDRVMLWLKAALLLGMGAYFVYIIVTGNLTNYINVRFTWLSYVAAAIFLLLGVCSVFVAMRATDDDFHHDHDGHDHSHSGLSWGVLAIVSVPLILGTLIPSRPLGATAISGNLSTSAALGSLSTFTVNPLDRNVLDWLRYFGTLEDYADANDERADVIGFVYREPSFPENQFMLARFTLSCCVADASALGLPVYWENAPDLEQDQWVRVQGSFRVGEFRGDTLPILHAQDIALIEQPEHPYLYP